MARLRYAARGGSLHFLDSGRRREIAAGAVFDVDDVLAGVLLRSDDNVELVASGDEDDVPPAAIAEPTGVVTVASLPAGARRRELAKAAKELGVRVKGTNEELRLEIAAEVAAREAAAAQAAEAADTAATANDDAVTNPSEPVDDEGTGGDAIVLGDDDAVTNPSEPVDDEGDA